MPASDCSTLTKREHEVLGLVVQGKRNKEIARQLILLPIHVKPPLRR